MNKPSVSVIVPVYNAENTLRACVDSVLAQTTSDFELILVDDGSQDTSGSICDAYAEQDVRIQVIHQKNAGVSAARNAGMDQARGEYLLFVDSDDSIEPEMMDTVRSYAVSENCDAVISGLRVFELGVYVQTQNAAHAGCFGPEIWNWICEDSKPFGWAGSKLLRTEVVKENRIRFSEEMSSQEDLDFLLSVYACCERIGIMPYAGYRYNYAPSKRTPPVWDYIANQLKLIQTAEEKTQLTQKAEYAVQDRIALLLYTFLYDAADHGTCESAMAKLDRVKGLKAYLQDMRVHDEKTCVARWYGAGRNRWILRYLSIRNRIRDGVRRIRRRTTGV